MVGSSVALKMCEGMGLGTKNKDGFVVVLCVGASVGAAVEGEVVYFSMMGSDVGIREG